MATVTFTLSDTATGSVSYHTDFKPAIGQPLTEAQSDSLEIMAYLRRKRAPSNPSAEKIEPGCAGAGNCGNCKNGAQA